MANLYAEELPVDEGVDFSCVNGRLIVPLPPSDITSQMEDFVDSPTQALKQDIEEELVAWLMEEKETEEAETVKVLAISFQTIPLKLSLRLIGYAGKHDWIN